MPDIRLLRLSSWRGISHTQSGERVNEQIFFVAGGVFLVLLGIGLVRLGRHVGGPQWAFAWFSLYTSGLVDFIAPNFPVLSPLVPILGTAFAASLIAGALLLSGRVRRVPMELLILAALVASARVAMIPFVSEGIRQASGAAVIAAAALYSSWALLRPPDRRATIFERVVGYSFPAIAAVSGFFAWSKVAELPVPSAMLLWLLVGVSLCILKVGTFIERATDRINRLRLEAEHSRHAHARVEAQYREVTEQASDMISEFDELGRFLYANPAHKVILGYEPDALLGTKADELMRVDVETDVDGISIFDHLGNDLTQQRTVIARHQDGRPRALECNVRPFIHSSGAKHFVVTSRDVTDRIATERVLEENREQLAALVEERTAAWRTSVSQLEQSQRLAAVGTLAAGIAHQINNPVGSIRMSAEFALASPPIEEVPDEWRDALENCLEQSRRCGHIVSSMLKFARNEPTKKTREDIAATLRRVCEQTQGYATDCGATLDTRQIRGPLHVQGSAIELEQALLNIVRNAVESASENVWVSVGSESRDGSALITVTDNGRGMEPDTAERVFEPFYTTRLDRGGTGLGLSVAHGVVADHRGTIAVESVPHIGTSIMISIPLVV